MYNDLEAKLHDLFWAEEGEPAELPLIRQFLQAYPGTTLELGCGSGRLLLPLLEEGYLIEGLDNSAEMLQLCEQNAGDSLPVLHHGSLEDFQTGSLYGAIMIPAFTLQFVPVEKLPVVLENMKSHLQPGGALYITTFIPWAEITGELEAGKWFLDQEMKLGAAGTKRQTARCHTRFQIKRLSQQLTREHRYRTFSSQGRPLETTETKHQLTWYWPREMEALLKKAGFTIQQTFGDFNPDPEEPLSEDGQIITVIATTEQETVDG